MTIFGKNDTNTEGMTIIWKKKIFLQLALLPPLGHKEARGTPGYPERAIQ